MHLNRHDLLETSSPVHVVTPTGSDSMERDYAGDQIIPQSARSVGNLTTQERLLSKRKR